MIWLLAALIVVIGLPLGWACAWFVHRYEDDDETDTAIFSTADCSSCGAVLLPLPTAARGGSCPECSTRLPATWWITTLALPASGLVMLATWKDTMLLVPFLWLCVVGVVASMVDIRLMLIPKRVVWVGLGVGLALILATTAWYEANDRPPGFESITDALIGAALYFGVLYAVWFVVPRGMGFGDVRLASVLGLYLGWIGLVLTFYGLLFGCAIGVVMGLIVRAVRKHKFFPFGPGMSLGALVAIAMYETILT
ncbi:MAG TPA: A24 family peptidase [Microthrixaceae bacterium]|nr:A24 family peptidase [Microthrixaceae bacterium]